MTTTRTMTVSELIHHLWMYRACEELAVTEFLGGVTIVPDPEPRPDFASMTSAELAAWIASNDPNDWAGLKRRMVLRANAIADAKGMGR